MKRIRARFTGYFAVGLLIFLVYFFFTLDFLIRSLNHLSQNGLVYGGKFIYFVDSDVSFLAHIAVVLFCFISGGFLFSLFLVQPILHIIRIITNLTLNGGEECYGNFSKIVNKKGNIKSRFFLYGEVFSNLALLQQALGHAEEKRAKTEAARKDWITGVSHDLKTPLSYINGYASLLLNAEHEWKKEELRVCLKEIYDKGVYIEKLINDLNFTFFIDDIRGAQLNYKKTDIVAFLRNLLADIANAPGADKFQFDFRSSAPQLFINFDDRLLYRALHNILINAVEYNPAGTEIEVSLSQRNGKVCIDIADNGIGIPAEELGCVFDKYYSRSKNQEGKGLGLFISKQIIEAHGANVAVQNNPVGGTIFNVTLSKQSLRLD